MADRTVAVGGTLDVFVGLGHFHVHTEAALLRTTVQLVSDLEGWKGRRGEGADLAVEEILSQSTPNTTDAAVVTMVYRLLRIVFPEMTDVAVVIRRPSFTMCALRARLLCRPAKHAQHVLRKFPG